MESTPVIFEGKPDNVLDAVRSGGSVEVYYSGHEARAFSLIVVPFDENVHYGEQRPGGMRFRVKRFAMLGQEEQGRAEGGKQQKAQGGGQILFLDFDVYASLRQPKWSIVHT